MVLIVLVPAGMNKPYFKKSEGLDKGTYIRFGRSTVKANADMIKDLQRQSQCRSFDMMSIHDAKLTDLDEKRIKVFLTREHKETDAIPNSILFANDLIIRENTSHYPTAGGILLFGKNPQKYFPGAITVCSHFTSKNDKTTISAINFNPRFAKKRCRNLPDEPGLNALPQKFFPARIRHPLRRSA